MTMVPWSRRHHAAPFPLTVARFIISLGVLSIASFSAAKSPGSIQASFAIPTLQVPRSFVHIGRQPKNYHSITVARREKELLSRQRLGVQPSNGLYWGYKLYEIGSDEDPASQRLYGSCERVVPSIVPFPKVMDEVENWYTTSYKTYRFHKPFIGINENFVGNEVDSNKDVTVTIRETSFGCGKLGGTVWESSLALSCHLMTLFKSDGIDNNSNENSKPSSEWRIIELGAGVGVPSCVCRELKVGKVLSTDYWDDTSKDFVTAPDPDRLIPHHLFGVNLEFNLLQSAGLRGENEQDEKSKDKQCFVRKLDWYNAEEVRDSKRMINPNLIIASAVVYYKEDVIPLIQTLEILLDPESTAGTSGDVVEEPVEALLFLPEFREAMPFFREKLEEMVNTHAGWNLKLDRVRLLLDDNEEGGLPAVQEENQTDFLRVSIKNG
mmetsp:Transcript_16012/g.33289  ORF Transcript_16012/g.33289 Transcript_16012/m.33289 type:complete len:437 (-) Transcript_16012:44-1354(-)